jgi:hypothetical protein
MMVILAEPSTGALHRGIMKAASPQIGDKINEQPDNAWIISRENPMEQGIPATRTYCTAEGFAVRPKERALRRGSE